MLKADQSHYKTLLQAHRKEKPLRVRFAPSPTGYMHLGNIYSALYTQAVGQLIDAEVLLRIEDIDAQRCRPEYEEQIYDDLHFAGFSWQEQVRRQSDHLQYYRDKLRILWDEGLCYPCFCSRKDIREKLARRQENGQSVAAGPEGPLYPQTCKHLAPARREQRLKDGQPYALRLDIEAVRAYLGRDVMEGLSWHDVHKGAQKCQPDLFGDVVIGRKDCGLSYHACVVLDDAWQNISLINRGIDLFHATHVHRILQALWGLVVPLYDHHDLMMSDDGRTFAKSIQSECLKDMRAEGLTQPALLQILENAPKTSSPDAKNEAVYRPASD